MITLAELDIDGSDSCFVTSFDHALAGQIKAPEGSVIFLSDVFNGGMEVLLAMPVATALIVDDETLSGWLDDKEYLKGCLTTDPNNAEFEWLNQPYLIFNVESEAFEPFSFSAYAQSRV